MIKKLRLRLCGIEPVRIITHYACDSRRGQHAHVSWMIHSPADDLEIVALGFGNHGRCNEIASNDKLSSANLQSLFDGLFDLAVVKQTRHESGFGLPDSIHNVCIEGDDDSAGDFARFAKRANQGMLPAP